MVDMQFGGEGLENGEMKFGSVGKKGKDFCPNVLQSLLENFDRRSCNDECRELIPVFHNRRRKGRPSPSVVARTFEYVDGVPSGAMTNGRKKNKFGSISKRPVIILNVVIRLTLIRSPLQGMKAQPLKSLFAGEVRIATYQPGS